MSSPSWDFRYSTDRWLVLPGPAEAKVSLPGRARAAATSSWKLRTGDCAGTTTTSGSLAASVIGAKSRIVS